MLQTFLTQAGFKVFAPQAGDDTHLWNPLPVGVSPTGKFVWNEF